MLFFLQKKPSYLLDAANHSHFLDCNFDDGNWDNVTARLCQWGTSDPWEGDPWSEGDYPDFQLTSVGFNAGNHNDTDLIKNHHFEGFKKSTSTIFFYKKLKKYLF